MKTDDSWRELIAAYLMKDRPPMGIPEAIATVAMYVSLTVVTLALIHAMGNILPVCP
jgi:hypothetical protein